MTTQDHEGLPIRSTCCPCGHDHSSGDITRRGFLQGAGGAAALGVALTGLTWSAVSAAEQDDQAAPGRRPLVVKPILVYSVPRRRHQTSWRSWGGIQTEQDAQEEMGRIRRELDRIGEEADFPVRFLPIVGIRGASEVSGSSDLTQADAFIVYAAGGGMDTFAKLAELGKDIIFFCRHKSGPVYLWYEIISPRYLRQHTDTLAVKGIDDGDVVIDSQDEVVWRLRALCGLRNTMGTKILAIGGPGAWAQPRGVVPKLVENKWKFEMKTVPYKDLGELIKEARADDAAARRARRRAGTYLKAPGNKLETKREFLDNAFLLEQVFRGMMKKEQCQAITINGCMGTIMPLAETSACMTLCLLNDAGHMAFCESDFVVIPSGVLMVNISGRPMFLNDPTYPHDGIITLAHCTAPRKMNGKELEPVRIMTHFESDYGAAPKVEMRKGQVVTNIVPDFKSERWVGLLGEIIEAPFMDICRSQIDIRYTCDDLKLAERMPGFHWMSCYGDYMREIGYALKKVQIEWETLA
ncbi:MAG: sugar isomerase [Planctomycetota bacterium]